MKENEISWVSGIDMNESENINRINDGIIGSLLGLAVGDALGAPVEAISAEDIQERFGILRDYAPPDKVFKKAKSYGWRGPGLYTDDTQQAIVILDTLLAYKGLDPEIISEWLAGLAKDAGIGFGVYRGSGKNFRISVDNILAGKDWTETGINSAGNGAAMRVAPIALYFHDDIDLMAEAVSCASLITHRNPLGIASAIAVAYFISVFIKLDGLEDNMKAAVIQEASEFCHEKELFLEKEYSDCFFDGYEAQLHLFSETLMELAKRIYDPFPRTFEWIAENASMFSGKSSRKQLMRPIFGFALASVVYSIYLTIYFSSDFEEPLVRAINYGGDTDTIGAITGSIAGALHGESKIPKRWLDGLQNIDNLRVRAESLAYKKKFRSKLSQLYKMELNLSKEGKETYLD